MEGINQAAVDYDATTLLLRQKASSEGARAAFKQANRLLGGCITTWQKGILEAFLSGAWRTQQRLLLAKLVDTDVFRFCKGVIEDQAHAICHCPAWDHLRPPNFAIVLEKLRSMPPCTINCGIFHEPNIQDVPPIQEGQQPESTPKCSPINCSDRTVVWTDGACARQAEVKWRRAGYGAWSADPLFCFSAALEGPNQSSVRAEAAAILGVLRRAHSPVETRTDCKAVFLRCVQLTKRPDTQIYHWNNADLWTLIRVEIKACIAAHPNFLVITKVKGHATWKDTENEVLLEDKIGNDEADEAPCTLR